jgi:NFU1 iron-sulfur cluster scaffold homolog, mitochondrial
MSQPIMIRATVDRQDINICTFTVDRPVYEGKITLRKEDARNNMLAAKLFEIAEVCGVEVDHNAVKITKDSSNDWSVLGRRVGTAIRVFLQPDLLNDAVPPAEIKKKVQEVLETQINPSVAGHGGFVELINVENNNVYIRMSGGCQGCGSANMTLKMGIERMIREAVPTIGQVLDVTDHGQGANPYYR